MLQFLGFDLELLVEGVLDDGTGTVRWARSQSGEHWLIVPVDQDPDHLVWVCAPISVRALRAVATGRATTRDAVQHSATGTVEVVTVDHGRAVPDRCVCCGALPEELLPPVDPRVLVGAGASGSHGDHRPG
jgi:hypothetical protein